MSRLRPIICKLSDPVYLYELAKSMNRETISILDPIRQRKRPNLFRRNFCEVENSYFEK